MRQRGFGILLYAVLALGILVTELGLHLRDALTWIGGLGVLWITAGCWLLDARPEERG